MKSENSHIIKDSFTMGHRTFNIHLTCPSSFKTKIAESMKKIYSWLYIASHFSQQPNCSKTLDIYLYWTDMKKRLPRKKRAVIDWEHANTAFTFSCNMPHSDTGEKQIKRPNIGYGNMSIM
jgi:hypothetical protein